MSDKNPHTSKNFKLTAQIARFHTSIQAANTAIENIKNRLTIFMRYLQRASEEGTSSEGSLPSPSGYGNVTPTRPAISLLYFVGSQEQWSVHGCPNASS